jgi:hypothetical protein
VKIFRHYFQICVFSPLRYCLLIYWWFSKNNYLHRFYIVQGTTRESDVST